MRLTPHLYLNLFMTSRRFKYYRLTALSYIVESLKNNDIHMRLRNESLALGAIIAYQFNAIIYRPAEGRAESVLLEAACQHIADGNGCSYPSMYNQGPGLLLSVRCRQNRQLTPPSNHSAS